MKINKFWLLIALVAIGLIGLVPQAYAAHTGGDVVLKSATGANIVGGSAVPYSPKKTCASTEGCHVTGGISDYESNATTVAKTHTQAGVTFSYNVPVPGHGVSSAYHVQQGLNLPWGDTQRSFYSLPSFTSAPGMVGKY